MRDPVMRSPGAALVWDIWLRHRTLVCLLIAVTVFTFLLNTAVPESFRKFDIDPDTFDAHDAFEIVNFHLMLAALLLFLAIFGYTEVNAQKGSTGFPHRLFTLPLTSFHLVVLPTFLGVAAFEVLGVIWQSLIFGNDVDAWTMIVVGTYIVVHQAVLWTLPGLGFLRVFVLGVLGIVFIVTLGLPTFPPEILPWWLRVNFLTIWLAAIAAGAFLASWSYVARERSGGGLRRNWAKAVAERLSALLPRRTTAFSSPAAAHFWFEWRRSGFMLPLLVAAMLIVVIGPLSWFMRNDGGNTMRILLAALALPMALAFPVGKGFSKPDWRSNDMSVPPFVAVRPLATADIVMTKMKVAAVSAMISWLLVVVFTLMWFGLWASWDGLNMLRTLLWSFYGRSSYPQYGLAVLLLVTGTLLTWRFLVSSLWLGLSGNRKLFATTAIPYGFAPAFALAFAFILNSEESIVGWMFHGFGEALPTLVQIAALAVAARFWFAAWSWRDVDRVRVRQYLVLWGCGTVLWIAFGLLLWFGVRYIVPSDSHQLRSLFILGALLAMPFGRIGLAPGSLARNRHRP